MDVYTPRESPSQPQSWRRRPAPNAPAPFSSRQQPRPRPRPRPSRATGRTGDKNADREENAAIVRKASKEDKQAFKFRNKIFVTGYPSYATPQDLKRVFQRFGSVRVDRLLEPFAVLCFDEPAAADLALAADHLLVYGAALKVQRYHPSLDQRQKEKPGGREFARSKQKSVIVAPQAMDLSGDFFAQVDEILARVRLTQEEVTHLSTLYSDLEQTMRALWPGCTAIPFGSITTGLGIKTSDADCFMEVAPALRHPQANFVNRAKRALQAQPSIFAEILSIPRANTPIVKFFHLPTGTNCDVSFKTPLGSLNSRLITFLLHLDSKLLPIAVLIKYWAKVHDLSGTGRMSNYTLTMMYIFYLQQPPMSILPSVQWLQRDRAHDFMVDYWNTGFMAVRELVPKSTNTSSIAELLGGFFQFYSTFDFENLVISPFYGLPVRKELFRDPESLPSEFALYKHNVMGEISMPLRINTCICVQDPFEQCHNVASGIGQKFGEDIIAFIKFAADAYEKEKLDGCKNFLKTILLDKPKIERKKQHPEFRFIVSKDKTASEEEWKDRIVKIVEEAFRDMLKLGLKRVEEKDEGKDKQPEREPKDKPRRQRIKYICTIERAVWKRKQFNHVYKPVKLDLAEKEARITNEILRVDKNEFKLQAAITISISSSKLMGSVISVKHVDGEMQHFIEFGHFYVSTVRSWLLQLLRKHNGSQDNTKSNDQDAQKNNGSGVTEEVDEPIDSDSDDSKNDSDDEHNDSNNGDLASNRSTSGSDKDAVEVDDLGVVLMNGLKVKDGT